MMKEEFIEQARALAQMHGDVLDLIAEHGEEFRNIINDFRTRFNRTPTAEDFIWIASEHRGYDLRKPETGE